MPTSPSPQTQRYGNDDFVPVILGTSLNAYNIARSLHVAYGVRSLALGRFAPRETAHSQIVDVRADPGFDDPARIVTVLQELATELSGQLPGRKLLLMPTIEFYTNVVIDHRAELEDHYLVPLVDKSLAQRLMNKTDFYRTCEQLDVPHPATRTVGPDQVDDQAWSDDLPFTYPVIVKPSNTDTYPRISFEGKQKVYLVQDVTELRAVAARIFAAGYADDLIVQDYIAGDESVMQVVNTYSDRSGRMRFLSAGQVALTEYDPRLVGNNNAIVTMQDPALTESIRHFLDSVDFVGTANFDIMLDRRDGVGKVLEMNMRQGATSYYTMAADGNLARCFVEDFVYGHELPLTVTTSERLWVNAPWPVVRHYTPASMQARLRAVARRGRTHTLRYRADRSLRRRLEVARIDLRQTQSYLRNAKNRPR